MKRARRNHAAGFKTKVALAAAWWLDRRAGTAQELLSSPALYITRGQGDQDWPN